jgi:alpha-glucosidase
VKDVIGKKGWPKEIGRDGERTPMQWNSSVNAGFNKGAMPWLPVDANYTTHNVATEAADPHSILNWYRQLIKLRRDNAAFYAGDYVALNESDPNVMSYLRKDKVSSALVVLNFSAQPQTVSIGASQVGASHGRVLAATNSQIRTVDFKKIELEPYGVVIAEVLPH